MSHSIQPGTPTTLRGHTRGLIRRITPVQMGVDIGLALLLLVLLGPFSVSLAEPGREAPAIAVSLLMFVAFAARRLSPGPALIVAWAGAVLQMATGMPPLPINVAIFGVLYVTAAYGNRAVLWAGFASTLLGAAAVTAYLFIGAGATQNEALGALFMAASLYIAVAFAFVLAWTVGLLVRTAGRAKRTRLAQAVAEQEVVIEQERGRIARDMHDVVAHSLAVVIAQADGARYAAKQDPDAAATALDTIASTARGALSDVRLLLTQLRHSQTEGPQPTLADLEQLYAQMRSAGAEVLVEVAPLPPGTPPPGIQIAVYRILQEALTNALRHGTDPQIWVRLSWYPAHVELEVRNATAAAPMPPGVGHGVIGMRERALLVGGRLDANQRDGMFIVSAMLPIAGAA